MATKLLTGKQQDVFEDCVHVIRYLSPVINNIRLNGELLLHIWKIVSM